MASRLLGAGGSQRGRRRRPGRGKKSLMVERERTLAMPAGVPGRWVGLRRLEEQTAEAPGADAEWLGGFKTPM